jgi:hypothetical protein
MDDILAFAARYGPAQPISPREAWEIESMLTARSQISGPAHSIVSDWLVRRAMKLKGWRTPYSWFRRTNVPKRWSIVSYHHPARLCWSWSLQLLIGRRVGGRWLQPWWSRRHGQTSIWIPHLIELHFHRQPYDNMLSGNAENLLTLLASEARQRQERGGA